MQLWSDRQPQRSLNDRRVDVEKWRVAAMLKLTYTKSTPHVSFIFHHHACHRQLVQTFIS
eukprot:3913219-Pleurochrysis_carterae.AAC.1